MVILLSLFCFQYKRQAMDYIYDNRNLIELLRDHGHSQSNLRSARYTMQNNRACLTRANLNQMVRIGKTYVK